MNNTILIIDDNEDLCENTEEILMLAGYKTFTAINGKEGIESALLNKPDLILCDIMMPVLDGYGVLRAVRSNPELSNLPFVFMTAKADKTDFRKGMDLGADDYFTKPFSGDDLLSIVHARLTRSRIPYKTDESNANEASCCNSNMGFQDDLDVLAEHRTIKMLRKRDILFMEGDSSSFLFFIVSGKVKIFKSNTSGKEYIIHIYKDGDFLGYSSLLENGKHKESAMAIENSEIALIPKQDFCKLLYSNNDVAIRFVKLLSSQYSEVEDKLLKLAYSSARRRVADAILYLSNKYMTEGKEELSFTLGRENISALSGITPESVSRNLTDFREEGLIEIVNGVIKVSNLKKIEKLKD